MSRQHSSVSPTSESPAQESLLGESPADQHGYASASTSPHRLSLGSEGYPSWLPQRPPPPAPGSTLQSSTGRYDGTSPNDPSPVWGGRKPTPRSVRIVSVPDSESGRREPTDQTRVSHAYPHTRVWSRATSSGIAPALFSSTPLAARPKFRARGLHLELLRHPSRKFRLYYYLFPLFVFVHIPLQSFLDFNAVFILLQVARYPNPEAPGVPGSGRNWALGAAAYTACWLAWIFVVFIVYELLYSFTRRWRVKRPLMVPLYLSSPAFNLVSMTSYANFCFMHHLRYSAFLGENGSIRDGLAETFWYYSQNLPTVALLLPRAGLSLALLFAFGHPEPDTVALAYAGRLRRDGTFFRKGDGTLTGYARGVLIANAAWTAWRVLVLLTSWFGLWVLSGQACAGLCGPRYRWEEEEHEKSASVFSETGSDVDSLPWSWKECTRIRIQEAFEFCLTIKPSPHWGKKEVSADAGPSLPPVAPSAGFEGVDEVLAAIGFPSAPQPARRGVLSDDLFESPTDDRAPAVPRPDISSIIPKIKKLSSKERQDMGPSGPLLTLPYPFTAQGAQVSSEDRIPFPPSPRSSSKKKSSSSGGAVEDDDDDDDDDDDEDDGEEEDEEEDDDGDEEAEGDDAADAGVEPSSGRASGSMSSLGHPVSSQYPFQFRVPRHSSGGGSHMSPGHVSSPSSNSRSIHSTLSRSTGNAESSDSHSPRSNTFSIPGAPSGMPMPPRHPHQGGRGRARAGTVPATSLPSSSSTPLGFPTGGRPPVRTRTDSGVSQTFGVGEPAVYESNGEDDYSDGNEVMMEQPEPEGPHEEAETGDVVGLLVPSSGSPSPRTSFIGLRSRASSHRQQGRRSRSGSNSRSNSHSGSGSSSSRSRPGSSLSAAARLRTQSLIQAISGASKSSVDLVQSARRSRANSSMARLEEDLPYFSDPHTHSRSGSDALTSSGENYTFGIPPPGHPRHPLITGVQRIAEGENQTAEEVADVPRTVSSSNLQPSPITPPSEHHSEQTVSNVTERPSMPPEAAEEPSEAGIQAENVVPSVMSSRPDVGTAAPVSVPPTVHGTDSSSGKLP